MNLGTLFLVASIGIANPPVQPTTAYLGIVRETAKPGQVDAIVRRHAAALRAWPRPGWPRSTIGLVSVTGTEEVWYLSFYPVLGDLEQDRRAVSSDPAADAAVEGLIESEGERLVGRELITAFYLPDLSYRPRIDWSGMRFLDVIRIHVRPGHHLEYLAMRKIALAGHERGGPDTHLPVFKITSGAPGNTYLILRPLSSLAEHDRLRAAGFGEPLTPAEDRRMVELQALSVDREDEQFFRVVPSISSVTAAWAASAPEFWRPAPH